MKQFIKLYGIYILISALFCFALYMWSKGFNQQYTEPEIINQND